jgi:hypothetical protein
MSTLIGADRLPDIPETFYAVIPYPRFPNPIRKFSAPVYAARDKCLQPDCGASGLSPDRAQARAGCRFARN